MHLHLVHTNILDPTSLTTVTGVGLTYDMISAYHSLRLLVGCILANHCFKEELARLVAGPHQRPRSHISVAASMQRVAEED